MRIFGCAAIVALLPWQAFAQESSAPHKSIDYSSALGDDAQFGKRSRQQVQQFSEAESQVKSWDCSIAKSQAVIEEYQSKLRDISQKMAPILATRDDAIARNLTELEERFGPYNGSGDMDLSNAGDALEKLGARYSARLVGILQATDDALVLIRAASGYITYNSAQHQIKMASMEFEHIRDQINYRGALLKTDWEKRDALVASWEEQGVTFQRAFYGIAADCEAPSQIFDGTWGMPGHNDAFYVVNANAFRFLRPREFKYTDYCTINYSEFRYLSATTAEVQYNSVCPDGSQGQRGKVTFAAFQENVMVSECSWDPSMQPGECLDPQDTGISLVKLSQ